VGAVKQTPERAVTWQQKTRWEFRLGEYFWKFKSSSFSNGLIDMRRKQPRIVARELLFDQSTFSLFYFDYFAQILDCEET
jgi:hypothetical protein